jgi:putative PIN family toxin of toxin-antitoxin system
MIMDDSNPGINQDIEIFNLQDDIAFLEPVISLGDKNNNSLGFFPKNAFIDAAHKGKIIVAKINNATCVGYLLFRIAKTKYQVSITHLCVDSNYRKIGVGKKLVQYLIENTKEWRGISLFCRRDYDSNSFWQKVGFKYIAEKKGRGFDQCPLSHYWYDHNHDNLFTIANQNLLNSKNYKAVIDMNIFVKLFENENHPLNAIWLREEIIFTISNEINNEICRDEDTKRRKEMLAYTDNFPQLKTKSEEVEEYYQQLSAHFTIKSDRDKSDLYQLSHAIDSESNFFVTSDKRLKEKLKDLTKTQFGLLIVSPEELIIQFDELLNSSEYISQRLVGSDLHISRLTWNQIDNICVYFQTNPNESPKQLRQKIEEHITLTSKNQVLVFHTDDGLPFVILIKNQNGDQVNIPLLRLAKGSFPRYYLSQLIYWITQKAITGDYSEVKFIEDYYPELFLSCLKENNYSIINGCWIKTNIDQILTRENTITYVKNKGFEQVLATNIFSTETDGYDESTKDILLEKYFWPLKIESDNIPAFIIPIKPIWAMDLFDYGLGNQTLFGSESNLILKTENVYYRSANIKYPTAPSRVLWYVSKNPHSSFQDASAIRACSYVDEMIVGFPKELYSKYADSGVYKWKNIFETSGYKNRKILLFKFSRTELFQKPIPLVEYKKMTGKKNAPIAPIKISNATFLKLYTIGKK